MLNILSIILLPPDAYIYIGWGILLLLSLVVFLLWRRCKRRRWLRWLISVPLVLAWYVFLWGTYVGFNSLEVVHVEFDSRDLPPEFDGYRIVQFSDMHIASYSGCRKDMVQRVVDSINAQHADLVVFTGDMQNREPSELLEHQKVLSTIKARDGVCSVLGNHDYPMYIDADDYTKYRNRGLIASYQRDMGWKMLNNGHTIVTRDSAHIVIAGMENDGEGRFPQLGDIHTALSGVSRNEFVVMLEHDPSSWRRKILPKCHAQLTLSGHTHGGQFAFFGITPAQLKYKECNGMYRAGDRALYVTKGVGGVIPIRFGACPEIVVITLRNTAATSSK